MRLIGKSKLTKLKHKNKGNTKLCSEIDKLISDIENTQWKSEIEMENTRTDADCVHNDGFYFFNISVLRTMILVAFDNEGDATVVWTGTHQEYERTFKNNINTIVKWLKINKYL